jgi:hypothetical protein
MRFAFFIFIFVFSLTSHAAGRRVVVTVPNAVVYSDLNMNSPIGRIPLGKFIRVGKVKRKYSTVVPIIVAGRVAYIKDSDITDYKKWIQQTKGEEIEKLRATEHDVDLVLAKVDDKLSQNNHMVLTAGNYSLGSEWDTVSQEFGDGTGNTLFNAKVLFEHRPLVHSWSWGAGLGQYISNQQNLELNITTLELVAYYTLFNFFDLLSVQVMGGSLMTAAFTLKTRTGDNYTGALFGYHYGAQVRLFPHSKIGAVAGLQYQIVNISGMDAIVIDGTVARAAKFESFTGAQAYLGLSYQF